MPEHPEQETPFLPFPKSGEDIAHRQFLINVGLDVGILVVLTDHHEENRTYKCNGTEPMHPIGYSSYSSPRVRVFFGSCAVSPSAEECGDKTEYNTELSYITWKEMFSYVFYFLYHIERLASDLILSSSSLYLEGHFIKTSVATKASSVILPVTTTVSEVSKS